MARYISREELDRGRGGGMGWLFNSQDKLLTLDSSRFPEGPPEIEGYRFWKNVDWNAGRNDGYCYQDVSWYLPGMAVPKHAMYQGNDPHEAVRFYQGRVKDWGETLTKRRESHKTFSNISRRRNEPPPSDRDVKQAQDYLADFTRLLAEAKSGTRNVPPPSPSAPYEVAAWENGRNMAWCPKEDFAEWVRRGKIYVVDGGLEVPASQTSKIPEIEGYVYEGTSSGARNRLYQTFHYRPMTLMEKAKQAVTGNPPPPPEQPRIVGRMQMSSQAFHEMLEGRPGGPQPPASRRGPVDPPWQAFPTSPPAVVTPQTPASNVPPAFRQPTAPPPAAPQRVPVNDEQVGAEAMRLIIKADAEGWLTDQAKWEEGLRLHAKDAPGAPRAHVVAAATGLRRRAINP